jgi:hypothetical protein
MKQSFLLILAMGIIIGVSVGLMLSPFIATAENVTIAMWLEVVHRVCTSVGGLGTFVALVFVVRQFNLLRTQSELVQKNTMVSMDGQLYSRLDSFNKFIVEHDKEYEMLDKPFERDEPGDHRYRLHHLCELGFTFYEEIYKHHVKVLALTVHEDKGYLRLLLEAGASGYVLKRAAAEELIHAIRTVAAGGDVLCGLWRCKGVSMADLPWSRKQQVVAVGSGRPVSAALLVRSSVRLSAWTSPPSSWSSWPLACTPSGI